MLGSGGVGLVVSVITGERSGALFPWFVQSRPCERVQRVGSARGIIVG